MILTFLLYLMKSVPIHLSHIYLPIVTFKKLLKCILYSKSSDYFSLPWNKMQISATFTIKVHHKQAPVFMSDRHLKTK